MTFRLGLKNRLPRQGIGAKKKTARFTVFTFFLG
jgi:hypothetical protein